MVSSTETQVQGRLPGRKEDNPMNTLHLLWIVPLSASVGFIVGGLLSANKIVDYNGVLYKSVIDGNTWSPEAYPAGWEEVTE